MKKRLSVVLSHATCALTAIVYLASAKAAVSPSSFSCMSHDRIDTVRSYDTVHVAASYVNRGVVRHVQRFTLPVGTILHSVDVELDGFAAENAGLVVVYGHEGGFTVPHFGAAISHKQPFAKAKDGREKVRIEFDDPIVLRDAQQFISVEGLAPGVVPLTDQQALMPYCTENTGLERYSQLLDYGNDRWETAPYSFKYELHCTLADEPTPIFTPDTLADGTAFAEAIHGKYISCEDINGDRRVDIVSGGVLLLNTGRRLQAFDIGTDSSDDGPMVFCDLDGNGAVELVRLPSPGHTSTYLYDIVRNERIQLRSTIEACAIHRVTSSMRTDVDMDGTTDLLVGGVDNAGKTVLGVLLGKKGGLVREMVTLSCSATLPVGGVTFNGMEHAPQMRRGIVLRASDGNAYRLHLNPDIQHVSAETMIETPRKTNYLSGLATIERDTASPVAYLLPQPYSYMAARTQDDHAIVVTSTNESGEGLHGVQDVLYASSITGSAIGDLDNDGYADVVLSQHGTCRYVRVLFGTRDGFTDGTGRTGLDTIDDADDLALCDLDNDGDLDIAVQRRGRLEIYKNTGAPYKGVTFDVTPDRHDDGSGVSARIHLSDGRIVTRTVQSGRGLNIHEPSVVHVGLGNAILDSALFVWPSPIKRIAQYTGDGKALASYVGNDQLTLKESREDMAVSIVAGRDGARIGIDDSRIADKRLAVSIVDLEARLVATVFDGVHPSASFQGLWSYTDAAGNTVPSGVYNVVVNANGNTFSKTMTIVR